MFGIGSTEVLIILAVALVVLGPKNLPGIARTVGKAMGEFRRASTDFQRTINAEVVLEEHEQKKKKEAEDRAAEEAVKTANVQAPEGEQPKDAA